MATPRELLDAAKTKPRKSNDHLNYMSQRRVSVYLGLELKARLDEFLARPENNGLSPSAVMQVALRNLLNQEENTDG